MGRKTYTSIVINSVFLSWRTESLSKSLANKWVVIFVYLFLFLAMGTDTTSSLLQVKSVPFGWESAEPCKTGNQGSGLS